MFFMTTWKWDDEKNESTTDPIYELRRLYA